MNQTRYAHKVFDLFTGISDPDLLDPLFYEKK